MLKCSIGLRGTAELGIIIAVCLSAGLWKNYLPDFHETWWKSVASAKEEPITFWSRSETWGSHTNYFSLLFTVPDRSAVTPTMAKSTEFVT